MAFYPISIERGSNDLPHARNTRQSWRWCFCLPLLVLVVEIPEPGHYFRSEPFLLVFPMRSGRFGFDVEWDPLVPCKVNMLFSVKFLPAIACKVHRCMVFLDSRSLFDWYRSVLSITRSTLPGGVSFNLSLIVQFDLTYHILAVFPSSKLSVSAIIIATLMIFMLAYRVSAEDRLMQMQKKPN